MADGGEWRSSDEPSALYLARVAARLRMPPRAEIDVLEELRAHLDDAVGALEAEGLTAADAEREALARLGSPDALGDELRQAHQTRRRLFAAVGGGMWEGLKDGIAGYIIGGILGPVLVLLVAGAVERLASPIGGGILMYDPSFASIVIGTSLSIAGWWAARGMVRATARRSFRRVEQIRRPIALSGGLALVALLLVWRMQYSWPAVIAMAAVPISFVTAALTARDPGGPRRRRWPIAWPSGIRVVVLAVGVWVVGAIGIAVLGAAPGPTCCGAPPGTTGDPWEAAGFGVVSPTVLDFDRAHWTADFRPDPDGNVAVTLDDDDLDWDAWTGLRVEAWRGAADPDHGDFGRIRAGETEPYLVVPLTPWALPGAIVPVGRTPGVGSYLLFVTGFDSSTGQRVAIGHPVGERVAFSGTIVDWFARLGR